MKTKPVSHKSQNTFKFQTFSEQLAQINVNVSRLIGRVNEIPDDADTFFHETLIKWDELNCTECYGQFKRDLEVDYQTLPQLVLNSKAVIECVKKHLNVPDSLAYPPLLELVVALARDLQSDFYPYFYEFFEIFVKLLLPKNVEVLEHVFRTIAYLFKILWRYMINDFHKIYSLYSGLLGDNQPVYIKSFAAESIAFLLRKVPNKDEMLNLIFINVQENPGLCQGVGLLLFEVVKNVRHQFHSCCQEFFYIVLSKLGSGFGFKKQSSWDEIVRCETEMMTAMVKHTTPECSHVIWKTFQKLLNDLTTIYLKSSDETSQHVIEHLGRMLNVMNVGIAFKDGRLFQWSTDYDKLLLGYLESENQRLLAECGQHVASIIVSVILSSHVKLPTATQAAILQAVYKSKHSWKVKWFITKGLFSYVSFNEYILPNYLRICDDRLEGGDDLEKSFILSTMAELIIHFSPPPLTGIHLLKFKKLNLDFGHLNKSDKKSTHGTNVSRHLERILKLQDEANFEVHIPSLWAAVVCIAHVSFSNHTFLGTHLRDLCIFLHRRVIEQPNVDESELFLLFSAITTMLLTTCVGEVEETITMKGIEDLLIRNSSNIYCLRIVDLYITFMKKNKKIDCVSDKVLEAIFPYLESNLASPFEEIRRVSLLILNHFKFVLPPVESEIENRQNVFDVCLMAENVELTIQEFRERIRILQLLEYEHIQSSIPVGFETVPLHYLIGNLFVPFEPLWEPAIKLIGSHANGMDIKKFWKVYVHYLKGAAEFSERSQAEHSTVDRLPRAKRVDAINNLFKDSKVKFGNLPARIDYINQRKLLWKAMLQFVDVAESRNRDLSPLLLIFMRNEYYPVRLEDGLSQNVMREEIDSNENEQSSGVESDFIVDVEEDDISQIEDDNNSNKSSSKYTTVILCAHLSLFSKFKNPKFIHLEPQLKQLYCDFLSHPNSSIQKIALDCIMSYKYEFLKPYKDNLYRLLDERTFKSELVLFSIGSEDSVVEEDHRSNVLPFLMRILYGLMQKKQGRKSSSKGSFNARRNAILQYLANSKEEEFKVFLDLIFMPLHRFIDGEILDLVVNVFSHLEFDNVIPLKKLERIFHLIGTIFKKFGGRISTFLTWLFKVLICMTARVTVLAENRDKVHPRYWKHLRILRKLALSKIIQFFATFDNYPFSREEIDALFIACVWPQLKRLPHESVRVLNHLLHLFQQWSNNPRYFPLLAKHCRSCDAISPLHQMMELLVNESTNATVLTTILEIVRNLVTMADFDPDIDSCPAIEVNEGFPANELASRFENWEEIPNFGSIILLPHIAPILQRLQRSIDTMGKSSKTVIPETNLVILNRLSEFMENGVHCATLVRMLIPFLSRKLYRNEETEVNIFSTITHLLKVSEDPIEFVNSLAPMFSSLENRSSRVALCEALAAIAERDPLSSDSSSLAIKLNAWDARRPEEPDYVTRMEGFQQAKNIEVIDPLNSSCLLVVLYNCCYMIRTNSDLAIRDNASFCLQSIASKFSSVPKSDVSAVYKTFLIPLLAEIKKGFRNKNENVRHEFIAVLAAFLRECVNFPQFSDLRLLINSDVEVDFLENIRHIQMHRRSRAMSKLSHGDLLQQLSATTLTQFVMPIVSSFLFNEFYHKHNYLVDASIALIGQICQNLDWNMYERFLKYYLTKISDSTEFQKMAVSTVVSILNGFHFDLSILGDRKPDKLIEPPVKVSTNVENHDCDSEIEGEVVEEMPDISNKAVGQERKCDRMTLERATKVYNAVTKSILPLLHKCITRKTVSDDSHRLAQSNHPDDDETLRVPVAIAMVKLLQRLPKGALDTNLPGILMKLCAFLKSRFESVRRVARQTLVTIMESLGVKYFPYVIKEMRQLLTRGYQVHSMTFTMHALLRHMVPHFKPGALDQCIRSLIEVFREELFGIVGEEKEVQQIVGKLFEAKGTKAYDAYEIMARFVSNSCLYDLISCLKEILSETTNHTVIAKIRECFKRIVLGLVQNEALTSKHFMVFAHGIMEDGLQQSKTTTPLETTLETTTRRPTSIFIVPQEPRRNKILATKSPRTNMHVSTEFGLEVLYFGMKRGKVEMASQESWEMLDPFVDLIAEYLVSPHVELVTSSMKILSWLLKLELPSLKKSIDIITRSLFNILKNYSRSNRQKSGGSDVVNICFKTITDLIRHAKFSKIEVDHLKMLLIYVERDISDSSKQALAFTMLKAILSKKLMVPEIHDLLTKISRMSITSEFQHVRNQCRQCTLTYLLDYPHGGKIDSHLQFFSAQLKYEHESGRESALEMLNSVISVFPQAILDANGNAATFFVELSSALVNDQSESCRRMSAVVVKVLISKVSDQAKADLFRMVETWLKSKVISVRKLAGQVCGLFVEVEKENFKSRLPVVLPLLITGLELGKSEKVENEEQKFDHLLIQQLQTLIKILKEIKIIRLNQYKTDLDKLWEFTHRLLSHPHAWIRLLASQLFGIYFAAFPVEDVLSSVTSVQQNNEFLFKEFPKNISSLANKFCQQLKSAASVSELSDQVAKNMVYLAKIVNRLPKNLLQLEISSKRRNPRNDERERENKQSMVLSVSWLIKKFLKEVKNEIAYESRVICRRSCFFYWTAAFFCSSSSESNKDILIGHLHLILPPLLREVTVDSRFTDESLKTLAQEVLDRIKKEVGMDEFGRHYALVQQGASEKKAKRKTDIAALAVVNPQLAAKRKMRRNIAKNEYKKRKVEFFNKGRPTKLQKL